MVGQFEPPDLPRDGAGERAFLAAEQLALDERRRNRGAVHAHHRPAAARAPIVDLCRENLFSRPGFPGQEHRGVGGGDLLDLGQHAQHGRALAVHRPRSGQVLPVAAETHLFFAGAEASPEPKAFARTSRAWISVPAALAVSMGKPFLRGNHQGIPGDERFQTSNCAMGVPGLFLENGRRLPTRATIEMIRAEARWCSATPKVPLPGQKSLRKQRLFMDSSGIPEHTRHIGGSRQTRSDADRRVQTTGAVVFGTSWARHEMARHGSLGC